MMRMVPKKKPLPKHTLERWRIVKGDHVFIRTGKDKGKTGVIKHVDRFRSRVIVEGARLATKHQKPTSTRKGGIFLMEAPIAVSNVALLDPKAEKPTPTRIRTGYLADGRKIRLSKRSGAEIPKPAPPERRPKPPMNPAKDTPASVVLKRTYTAPTFGDLMNNALQVIRDHERYEDQKAKPTLKLYIVEKLRKKARQAQAAAAAAQAAAAASTTTSSSSSASSSGTSAQNPSVASAS